MGITYFEPGKPVCVVVKDSGFKELQDGLFGVVCEGQRPGRYELGNSHHRIGVYHILESVPGLRFYKPEHLQESPFPHLED